MIDLEAVDEIRREGRFDKLAALLIGVVALLAAMLVQVQGAQGLAQARAQAQARRMSAEISTRIIASGTVSDFALINSQQAILDTVDGLARGQAGLLGNDPALVAGGNAISAAGFRLQALATEMGALPREDTPLDPYAASAIRSSLLALSILTAIQGQVADSADAAGANGSEAVMGLSVAALAGVFAGLAAVVGSSRTGRSLLVLAWACAAGAAGLLLLAADVLG